MAGEGKTGRTEGRTGRVEGAACSWCLFGCSGERMGVWDKASKTLGINVPSWLYSFRSTFLRVLSKDSAEREELAEYWREV